jgi:hypothetical protein
MEDKMNIENITRITNIIKRERVTNNLIYTLRSNGVKLEPLSLKHSDCLFSLLKTLSTMGFNTELEDPKMIDLSENNAAELCLEDIIAYSKYLNSEDEKLKNILVNLIEIKALILKFFLKYPSLISPQVIVE